MQVADCDMRAAWGSARCVRASCTSRVPLGSAPYSCSRSSRPLRPQRVGYFSPMWREVSGIAALRKPLKASPHLEPTAAAGLKTITMIAGDLRLILQPYSHASRRPSAAPRQKKTNLRIPFLRSSGARRKALAPWLLREIQEHERVSRDIGILSDRCHNSVERTRQTRAARPEGQDGSVAQRDGCEFACSSSLAALAACV